MFLDLLACKIGFGPFKTNFCDAKTFDEKHNMSAKLWNDLKIQFEPGEVTQAFNPSLREAKAAVS